MSDLSGMLTISITTFAAKNSNVYYIFIYISVASEYLSMKPFAFERSLVTQYESIKM